MKIFRGGQQRGCLDENNVILAAADTLIYQTQTMQRPHPGLQLAQARGLHIGQQHPQIIPRLVAESTCPGREKLHHLVSFSDDVAQVGLQKRADDGPQLGLYD